MIHRTYKYRIYPTKQQEELLEKHFGCVRFVYNWGLELKSKSYTENKTKLTLFELSGKLPSLKEEYPWLGDVAHQSLSMSLRNLDNAYTQFFHKNAKYPKFKSKHEDKQSFQCPLLNRVDFELGKLYIMKFREGIKTKFDRTFEGKIKTVTISRTSTNKYFASVLVEQEGYEAVSLPIDEQLTLGIDVGIKDFLITSDGQKFSNPSCLKKSAKKLGRMQHSFARKHKTSNRRKKQKLRIAKLHEKVSNQRNDFLHKITHQLVSENQATSFAIEDLEVKNMMQNRKLSKAISDVAWGEFFRQLKYKSERSGKNILEIGRFEPSSKMCSACGSIKRDLTLKDREWTCESCGATHDRDVNAAINIKNFALIKFRKSTAGSVETKTSGEYVQVDYVEPESLMTDICQ